MAAKKVRYIPEGYHTVTPSLIVRGAAKAIEFYKRAFNATELYRLPMPNGLLAHAEIVIGQSRLMLSDEAEEYGTRGPETLKGTPVGLSLYVEDCDAIFRQAIGAGGKETRPMTDQFYGDRSGTLTDPFGHQWTVATHIEDVTAEEMARRMAKMPAPG